MNSPFSPRCFKIQLFHCPSFSIVKHVSINMSFSNCTLTSCYFPLFFSVTLCRMRLGGTTNRRQQCRTHFTHSWQLGETVLIKSFICLWMWFTAEIWSQFSMIPRGGCDSIAGHHPEAVECSCPSLLHWLEVELRGEDPVPALVPEGVHCRKGKVCLFLQLFILSLALQFD